MNEQPSQEAILSADVELDAFGFPCPIPLLKTRLEVNRMDAGQVLKVISNDAGTKRDFRTFVSQSTHELVREEEEGGVYSFWLRIGAA
ncbi:sulfurtransferase TusA family protein [Pseudomonas baetica]|uniref:sulfurtransferase TusA family protein n=1 Tax=Pseudomonas baetica TaxID=674054 RepID=UPI002406679A|nr:sulfurtransferase TusA family protein [Pseudomonas baetica]